MLYGGCWVRRRKDSVQCLKCRIKVRPNVFFLFSINYPKFKASNSICLQVLLRTSYPIQYVGVGSSFQKKWARIILYANLLSSSHSHLDRNGLYLILEDFWERKGWTPTSHQLWVKGCELHPVLSKGHAEGVRVSAPYSIHCLPLHGCTNVWMTQREDTMVVRV